MLNDIICYNFDTQLSELMTNVNKIRQINIKAKHYSFTYVLGDEESNEIARICCRIDRLLSLANRYIENVSTGATWHSCMKFANERLSNIIDNIEKLFKELETK